MSVALRPHIRRCLLLGVNRLAAPALALDFMKAYQLREWYDWKAN